MAHTLEWLVYDFLIAVVHFLNLRASVSSWLICFNIGETFAREYTRVKMVKIHLFFVVPQGHFRWATPCE